jgi:NitT/TauT family transport system permease protein
MTKNRVVLSSLSFFVLLAVWSLVSYTGLIKDFFLPTPTAVAKAVITLFVYQNFLRDVAMSVSRVSIGFAAATLIGVPVGIIIGLSKRAETFIEPVVDFIRYTPIPAFIPLFILWFGIGETEKIIVIGSSVFFQIVLMVANSVSLTPKPIVESALTLGVTRWQIITKVIYPFSRPRILDDLRVSMGWAWAVLTIAEIVGATSGIGFVIIQSQRLLQTARVIGAIIVIGSLGILTDALFKWLYRFCFPWASKIHQYVGI